MQLFNRLVTENIQVEVLVNNAGFGVYGRFHETSWGREREMIQLNMIALTELTKLFLPGMVARKSGRILNVASTAAFQPGPLMAIYFATKAFVLYFSEAIAEELRNSGVSVTALCPGATETEFFKSANMSQMRLLQATDSARDVAEEAYRALVGGQRVIVTGWRNKLLSASVRFVPRLLGNRLAMKLLEKS